MSTQMFVCAIDNVIYGKIEHARDLEVFRRANEPVWRAVKQSLIDRSEAQLSRFRGGLDQIWYGGLSSCAWGTRREDPLLS